MSLRVMTWNTAGRKSRIDQQIRAISEYRPDVVALQEVTKASLSGLQAGVKALGLNHACDSFSFVKDTIVLTGPRRYGQIIASRYPIKPISPGQFDIPWPERVSSCWIVLPRYKIEFHTTHVPPGSGNKWIKIETFEGIYRRLARKTDCVRLLCGDFNSPDIEYRDGRVKVFGESVRKNGTIVPRNYAGHAPGRWAAGERSVVLGLAKFGMPDVFRMLRGYDLIEASWYSKRKHKITKRRFDHVFASPQLNPIKAEYLHKIRENGLSDHSPLLVEFQPFTACKGC